MNVFQKIAVTIGVVFLVAFGFSLQYAKCNYLFEGDSGKVTVCMLSGGR
jgi:hypothetical protein